MSLESLSLDSSGLNNGGGVVFDLVNLKLSMADRGVGEKLEN